MRNSTLMRHRSSRILTIILTVALIFGQTLQPVLAQLTPLADQAIAAKVTAKPNIFYTLDDSGSMQLNYIPEYVISAPASPTISTITRVGSTATATLAVANANLQTNDWVTIAGATQPEYNGPFQITVLNSTHFTYTVAGAPATPATTTTTKTYNAGSRYCRGGTDTAPCTAILQSSNTWNWPPYFAADFNRMMYNPSVTYLPPVKADGLPFTNGNPFSANQIDAKGNQGNGVTPYTKVQRDPYNAMSLSTVQDNLSTKVTVPMYCNTDWPRAVTANPSTDPITIGDVGDVNGEYKAGTGAWCRINGTNYDMAVSSGAPATAVAGVEMGYNYPWASSTGTVGPQYFFKVQATKSLWCDTTSPFYPRSGTITGCNGGVGVAGGAPTQQSCNAQAPTNVCNPTVALRNFTPANCGKAGLPYSLSYPLYCPPGVGGSTANTFGTGALPECSSCACNTDFVQAPVPANKCSSSGAACTHPGTGLRGDLSECPDIPNPAITSCTGGNAVYGVGTATCGANMFDPATNLPKSPVRTMLTDSENEGMVCRHNMQSYVVYGLPQPGLLPAALATYPRTQILDVYAANKTGLTNPMGYVFNQTGAFTQQITSGCPAIAQPVAIPRHYYTIASVQFCSSADNTPDGQWRGFGTGACQAQNDLVKFRHVKYGPFTRWDLITTGTFPSGKPFLFSGTQSLSNPTNSESINYANWYADYATRLNAAKTTSALGFANLTTANPLGDYRVGFQNLGEEKAPYGAGTPLVWVDVADWTLAQRTAWYNALFGIKVNNFKTPTIDAMYRIGALVESGPSMTLADPAINKPASAIDPFPLDAASNPITCTNNYHILFTDGTTNQVDLPAIAGDQDQTLPSLPPVGSVENGKDNVLPFLGTNPPGPAANHLAPGSNWPAPYMQGTPAVPNTIADVAAYYWARDLRTGPVWKDNVPAADGSLTGCFPDLITLPAAGIACSLDWTQDVAWWQHVSFSAISFGTEGTLDAGDRPNTMARLMGQIPPGFTTALTWPDLTQPNNPTHPLGNPGAVAVDDLWHGTVMSRGSFVSAKSPVEVSQGLGGILAGIQNQRVSRSAAAFDGSVLNDTNKIIYVPTAERGWWGDVQKIEVDPTTGAPITPSLWSANTHLTAQIQPALPTDEPWLTNRRVVTLANNVSAGGKTAGPGVPFQYANLTVAPNGPTMLASLASDPVTQQKVIAYLRGGSTFSAGTIKIEGTGIGQFRKRFGRFGDISNAAPLVVGPPGRGYDDDMTGASKNPGYKLYTAAQAARSTAIVAAANDGMVHVIDAGPVVPPGPGLHIPPGGGDETFAFMPKAIFRGVAGNPMTEDKTAIQALTYQDGGAPIFHHHMYVDSSPRVADVDFNNGIGSSAATWHTIVVGGLGKGGPSYYALDLTDPTAATEGAAASKVMWEWSDPEIAYTYGRPVIVKVRDSAFPTGRWVVIVTAGYNNVSEHGKIYFLDAKTGVLLATATTPAGNNTTPTPSGLAQIHAFVKDESNQIAEQIYGGDLLGNFWRIDVSTTDQYKAATPVLFAQLKDPAGQPQPVTTAPQIEIDLNNGIDRYVFIGTGRLLDEDDLTIPATPQTQTMYAIRDDTLKTPIPDTDPRLPIQPRVTMNPINPDGVSAIVGGAPNGWYHDLPNAGTDRERIVTDVQANDNVAIYIGTSIPNDPCLVQLPATIYAHDYTTGKSLLESGASIVPSFVLPNGGVGAMMVGRQQPDGSITLGVMVSAGDPTAGTQPYDLKNPVTGPGARFSWRLLTGE
jgi:type IV pilus assembly protein PilY1